MQVWELPKERNATSEVICINNNVTNFIATLEALDFPRSAIFSLSDLESTGGEERWATSSEHLLGCLCCACTSQVCEQSALCRLP